MEIVRQTELRAIETVAAFATSHEAATVHVPLKPGFARRTVNAQVEDDDSVTITCLDVEMVHDLGNSTQEQ